MTPQMQAIIDRMLKDHLVRTNITKQSHKWFFAVYLSHYLKHETAPFQEEMFKVTEDENIKTSVTVSFRGSAKSTIMALSYPIWAILGKQQKKFILLISQTQSQARQLMTNLKQELETNEVLRADLGPFETPDDEWRSFSIVLPKYGARITAVSSEQSIRGIRHGIHRPDLVICDDLEDLNSVKTREGRDKTYQWLTGDIFPCGDKNTKIVIVGNLLHEDSVLMRLKQNIEEQKMDGVFKFYPLIDDEEKIAWPGKYPTMDDIEELKSRIGNEISWQREYLLHIVPSTEQAIRLEWIKTYDKLPDDNHLLYTITAVDLAVSEQETADFTAAVSAKVYHLNDERYIYILPNPLNERLTFPRTLERLKLLSKVLGNGYQTRLVVEDVGYQKSIIQQLKEDGFPAEGFGLKGNDKRTRLVMTSHLISSGRVLFPKKGVENLTQQLVGFGVEKHDDLADAFAILVLQVTKDNPGITECFLI